MVKVSRVAEEQQECYYDPNLVVAYRRCSVLATCGLVQGSLVLELQQAVGGVLQAPLHSHRTGGTPVLQLTAGHAGPTFCHVRADVDL